LGDLERLDARVEAIKQAMEFAASLKCRVLNVRLGNIPSDEASEDRSRLLGVLNDLSRFGNHVGATLAATPSRESPDTLAQLVSQVTQGPLGVNFDAPMFLSAGSDPREVLQILHQLIVHVQVRDAVREAEGPAREVQLGRGEVEWDALLALLDESGYRGWLTVDRTEGSDKRNDAARAIEYLRRIGLGG
jgi:sugar phosphate isomerase/epimerase